MEIPKWMVWVSFISLYAMDFLYLLGYFESLGELTGNSYYSSAEIAGGLIGISLGIIFLIFIPIQVFWNYIKQGGKK